MALSKEIENGNGVTLKYHRITAISIVTNVQNAVEVASYTSDAKRQEEAEAVKGEEAADTNVYIFTTGYVLPYDQTMTVESAYEYLKTLPEFSGAEDC